MAKVAFVFSQFPAYDETFILREMNGLQAASYRLQATGDKAQNENFSLQIYSLKTPKDKIVHEEAKDLLQATCYMPFFSAKLLACDLFYLFRYPLRYLGAFFTALLGNIKSPNFFFKTCAVWYKAVGFARLAREHGITHVHGQWATYPATVAFIISRLNNIPFSFTAHAHDIYLDTTMLAFKIRQAKFVVTCTEDNKRYLNDLAPKCQRSKVAKKIIVNYHGLELKRFARSQVTGHKSQVLKILSVGSLLECKGFEYLIEACAILREKGVDFECTIAGGGPLEDNLKLKAEKLGLLEVSRGEAFSAVESESKSKASPQTGRASVRFTGYITQDKLIPLYKEADVFVLAMVPEKHWGIPNVLVEAMAASVPVVCTMLPSIPELVKDGETGFIIPAKDAAAIALAIEKLRGDEALRQKIISAGLRAVREKFDAEKNVEKLKGLFS